MLLYLRASYKVYYDFSSSMFLNNIKLFDIYKKQTYI